MELPGERGQHSVCPWASEPQGEALRGKVLSLNASPGLEWHSEDEIMMPTRGWEQSGTDPKDCEGSSWGHGFV